jgi:hypothetical protein
LEKKPSIVEMIIGQLENLRQVCEENPDFEKVLAASMAPVNSVITGTLDQYAKEVHILELEVGPQKAWLLMAAHDNLVDLTSEERAAQIEAAKRLARIMMQPTLSKVAQASLNRSVKELEVKGLELDAEEYLRGIVLPEGLILALGEMDIPQKVRLGRKWVVDTNGKVVEVRPVYGLSVVEFVRWLSQKTSQAVETTLVELLETGLVRKEDTERDGEYPIDKAAFDKPGLVVTLVDFDRDPTKNGFFAKRAAQDAQKQIAELLTKLGPKEQELIKNSLKQDGDLLALLREQGVKPETIRQKRKRLREKIPKVE